MRIRRWRILPAVLALGLVAAACGSSDDTATSDVAAPEPITDEPAAEEPAADEPAPEATDEPAPAPSLASTATDSSAEWSVTRLGEGIKPALALAPDGTAGVAYLTEAQAGGIFFAAETDGWAVEVAADGYFYGPIDLAFDADGVANVVYHDHQAPTFRQDAGDLTLAVRGASDWSIVASDHPGHDGWDSAIRFGPDGQLWAAGIEPVDFGTTDGVEFYTYDGSTWAVDSIGGPAITYQFNVAMAESPEGEPVLSYYDDGADRLHVASRSGDTWTDEVLPTDGGQFSSLVIDASGTRHITYYAPTDRISGEVRYGVDDGSGWQIEAIGTLDQVVLGMTGARRITSLQVLDDGTPVVAVTDQRGVWVATRGADGWTSELVLPAGDVPLGQQVQLVVADDAWHLATYEVTQASPLEGEVLYLRRSAA